MQPPQTKANPGNFSYGDPMDAAERKRTWPDTPPDVMLWRVTGRSGREEFALLASITYDDREHQRRITVPNAFHEYTTDLTSVPDWFTWLVPKSGAHLPAALIHDGLVCDPDGPATYVTDPPGLVDRIDADEIFRNAMRDTHVGVVRRWLVWAAVSTASLWVGPRREWPTRNRVYYRAVLALLLGTILYLGACATLDLFDRPLGPFWDLPWMREGSWWSEALGGLAGAVVIPSVLGLTWLRYWRAGVIAGVALAGLFHVTLAIGALALSYQALERLVARLPWVAVALGVAVWVGAVVLFVSGLV